MIDLKPYGAFIEYTIRPLIGELKWLLKELKKQGIKITDSNVKDVLKTLLDYQLVFWLIDWLKVATITITVSLVAFKILAS